jgi:transcriptional regulator with XRE-family HTH domain
METLGERISRIRKLRGLSQTQLGDMAECGQSTISMLENNERTERPDLILIAHALGVDAYWLKTGIEPIIGGDKRINEVVRLMQETSESGRAVVLDKAKDMSREYPFVKQSAA